MEQILFKMKLKHGAQAEYRKRHAEIWPELVSVLKHSGIKHYEIFYDEETDLLVAIQYVDDTLKPNLPDNKVMQKWGDYMAVFTMP
jgi:L-rhamnose mutarotase